MTGYSEIIHLQTVLNPDLSGSRKSANKYLHGGDGTLQIEENGLSRSNEWILGVGLNPYSVVHCSAEALFAAEVFFCRLHRHMSQ